MGSQLHVQHGRIDAALSDLPKLGPDLGAGTIWCEVVNETDATMADIALRVLIQDGGEPVVIPLKPKLKAHLDFVDVTFGPLFPQITAFQVMYKIAGKSYSTDFMQLEDGSTIRWAFIGVSSGNKVEYILMPAKE